MNIKTLRLTIKTFSPAMAEKLNIKEVYGICIAENTASVRVLEKIEFDCTYIICYSIRTEVQSWTQNLL